MDALRGASIFDLSLTDGCSREQRVETAGFFSPGELNGSALLEDANDRQGGLLEPGTLVANKYLIEEVLGTGGSAVVYAAQQVGLGRRVAFKLCSAASDAVPLLIERFRREASLLARIRHPHVVAVYDAGALPDGSPYLVVQRLRGDTLATRLLAGPLPVSEAVALTRQVLSALDVLCEHGITHRDVKPDNLMFDRQRETQEEAGDERVGAEYGKPVLKLVDFGVAKVTESDDGPMSIPGEVVGTSHYMSPEQLRGEWVDPRSDLYALGATLYEMLTGRTPHEGDTLHEVALATLYAPITPIRVLRPDCPEELESIVFRALAREREARYTSAREMLAVLDCWEAGDLAPSKVQPVPQSPPAGPSEARRSARGGNKARPAARRTPLARSVCMAVLACLAMAGGWSLSREIRLRYEATLAPAPGILHIGVADEPDTETSSSEDRSAIPLTPSGEDSPEQGPT